VPPFEGGTTLELPDPPTPVPSRGFVPFIGGVPLPAGGEVVVPLAGGIPPDVEFEGGQGMPPFEGGTPVLELLGGDEPSSGLVPFCAGVPAGGWDPVVPFTGGIPPDVEFEGGQGMPSEGGVVLEFPGGDVPSRGLVPFCAGVPAGGWDPVVPFTGGIPPDVEFEGGQSMPSEGGVVVLELPGGDKPSRGLVPFCGLPIPPTVELEGGKGQGAPFEGGTLLELPGAPSEFGSVPLEDGTVSSIHELMVSAVMGAC